MKNFTLTTLICALILSMTGCGTGKKATENKTITISGAFALYPLAVKWAEQYKVAHPEVTIDISAGGAGKGMTDVLAGMGDIAMVSREVNPQEKEKGAIAFPVAKDAVAAIVNAQNPLIKEIVARGLSLDVAREIWLDEKIKNWGEVLGNSNKSALHLYTRSDACGAAETWAAWMGKNQEDLAGVQVFGDPGIVAAVQKDPLALGYANLGYIYDDQSKLPNEDIVVLPIDINGNGQIDENENICTTKNSIVASIESGVYPSPPARELYLVTNGKPQNSTVVDFIKYVLTEGQKENIPAGYVGASATGVTSALQLLEKE